MHSSDFMRGHSAGQMPATGLAPQSQPYGSHGIPSSTNRMANQHFQPISGYANPGINMMQANTMYQGQYSLCVNRDMSPMTSSIPSNVRPCGTNSMLMQRRTPSNSPHSYNTNSRHLQQLTFSTNAHSYNSTGDGTSKVNGGFSTSTNSHSMIRHTKTTGQRRNSSHLISPPEENLQSFSHPEGLLPNDRVSSDGLNEFTNIKNPTQAMTADLSNQYGQTSAEAEIVALRAQVQSLLAEKHALQANNEKANDLCYTLQQEIKKLRTETEEIQKLRAQSERIREQGKQAVATLAKYRVALDQARAENQELHRRLQVYESNVAAREAVRRGSSSNPIDVSSPPPAPAILVPASIPAAQPQPQPRPDPQPTSQPEPQPQSQPQTSQGQQRSAPSPPKPARFRTKIPVWYTSGAKDGQRRAFYPDGTNVGKPQGAGRGELSESLKRKLVEDAEADNRPSKPARKKQKKEMTEWEKKREKRMQKLQQSLLEEPKRRTMGEAGSLEREVSVESEREESWAVEQDENKAMRPEEIPAINEETLLEAEEDALGEEGGMLETVKEIVEDKPTGVKSLPTGYVPDVDLPEKKATTEEVYVPLYTSNNRRWAEDSDGEVSEEE